MSTRMNSEDVIRIANLARIKLTEEEITKYTQDLNDIVAYAETLKAVNIDNAEPMVTPLTGVTIERAGVTIPLRKDEVVPSLGQKATTQAASQVKNGHFRVPRTIGEG